MFLSEAMFSPFINLSCEAFKPATIFVTFSGLTGDSLNAASSAFKLPAKANKGEPIIPSVI